MTNLLQSNKDAILELNNVVCRRGYTDLFDGVSFRAHTGDIIQISGVNGSGKSTLLRSICGLHQQHNGTIKWNLDSAYPSQNIGSRVGYLGHKSGLNSNLSARENLQYISNLFGQSNITSISNNIEVALQQLGASHYADLAVAKLSAGQKQTISLCRFLLEPRKIWLLDEPATALDQTMISKLVTLCSNHLSECGLVIYTSHQSLPGISNSAIINLTRSGV